ncbi:MAG: hypothetical protein M3O36_20190 [Myxococcota bacterium]|nr:hypothetical protein [Myxococcota bacterium]
MSAAADPHATRRRTREPLLLDPPFADRADIRAPRLKCILAAWADAVDGIRHPERVLNTFNLLFQIATLAMAVVYVARYATAASAAVLVMAVWLFGVVYNTVWYHRYCSHRAFSFSRPWISRLFLWSNPLVLREEVYAIPHRGHHKFSDTPKDPHGPHLGWLASFLAHESLYRINRRVGPEDYRVYCRSMQHVGIVVAPYELFIRTGSLEHVGWYAARTIVAHLGWCTALYLSGGTSFVLAWYTAICVTWLLIRDFQWRGHGAGLTRAKKRGWEFDMSSRALNQRFYGYIAGEWHDNHHQFPVSANNGFLRSQPDMAFVFIRALHRLGLVATYSDAAPRFLTKVRGHSGVPTPRADGSAARQT